MPPRRVALALSAALAACGALRSGVPLAPGCEAAPRHVRADGLCEVLHRCPRPPDGPFDRIGLRRLARCDGGDDAVLLYLPGGNMNGAVPEGTPDLRTLLAADGVVVWSLDYRTHAVPASAGPAELRVLADWTADRFTDDARVALHAVGRAERRTPWLAGFSYGAGLAYRLVAGDAAVAGLVVLDGSPPDGRAAPPGEGPAIDLAGGRLGWPDRERLLSAVRRDPDGPSPVPGFETAGTALAEIVDGARAFGGRGGLSGVKDGTTDVHALAALLATYDRWWPRAALGGPAVKAGRTVPVIAFATERMGAAWTARVRAGAIAFGGAAARVHELAGYGHVDVLVGRDVRERVGRPIREFVAARDRR